MSELVICETKQAKGNEEDQYEEIETKQK